MNRWWTFKPTAIIRKYLSSTFLVDFISDQINSRVVFIVILGFFNPVAFNVLSYSHRYLERIVGSDIVYDYDSVCTGVVSAYNRSECLLSWVRFKVYLQCPIFAVWYRYYRFGFFWTWSRRRLSTEKIRCRLFQRNDWGGRTCPQRSLLPKQTYTI